MEKIIELRAKKTYIDVVLNTTIEYNNLLNDMYKNKTKKNLSEERARELLEKDVAYLVSIKRKVKE